MTEEERITEAEKRFNERLGEIESAYEQRIREIRRRQFWDYIKISIVTVAGILIPFAILAIKKLVEL